MFNIKKKITSLIPSDSRGALQNVLTVEWGSHKTVLVEVPQASSSRSNEVEMNGMGSSRDYSNYGKLEDDDQEERAYLNQQEEVEDYYPKSRSFRERSQSQTHTQTQNTPKPLPSVPAIPPRPQSTRIQSNNPFNTSAFDDFGSDSNTGHLQVSQFTNDTFGVGNRYAGGAGGKKAIGGVGEWGGWDDEGMGTTSPTSSSRTGTTTTSSEEDPFR